MYVHIRNQEVSYEVSFISYSVLSQNIIKKVCFYGFDVTNTDYDAHTVLVLA